MVKDVCAKLTTMCEKKLNRRKYRRVRIRKKFKVEENSERRLGEEWTAICHNE